MPSAVHRDLRVLPGLRVRLAQLQATRDADEERWLALELAREALD